MNRAIHCATNWFRVLMLLVMVPLMASAYTLVLKDGRRVEIPDNFTVTSLTLTYQTAPGINFTILMANVDIPATEKANNELRGSLLRRASKPAGASSSSPRIAKRGLTQADVEAGRLMRQKSEQAYERRRIELGLPSLEESRRRHDASLAFLREETSRRDLRLAQSANNWRVRAQALREEIAGVDAQIGYIRALLSRSPENVSFGSSVFLSNTPLAIYGGRARTRFPAVTGHPGFMRGPVQTQPSAGFAAFGGTGIQIGPGSLSTRGAFPRRGVRHRRGSGSLAPLIGFPGSVFDDSQERAQLVQRLHLLEAHRAELQARWNLLEEEARRKF